MEEKLLIKSRRKLGRLTQLLQRALKRKTGLLKIGYERKNILWANLEDGVQFVRLVNPEKKKFPILVSIWESSDP